MSTPRIEDFTTDEVALIANAVGLTINWHKEQGMNRTKYGRRQSQLYRNLSSKLNFLLEMASPTDDPLNEGLVATTTLLRVDTKSVRRLNTLRKKAAR